MSSDQAIIEDMEAEATRRLGHRAPDLTQPAEKWGEWFRQITDEELCGAMLVLMSLANTTERVRAVIEPLVALGRREGWRRFQAQTLRLRGREAA